MPKCEFFEGFFYCGGFGYDAASDDYKLVIFETDKTQNETVTQAVVYSLKANCWRRIDNYPLEGSPSTFTLGEWGKHVADTLNWWGFWVVDAMSWYDVEDDEEMRLFGFNLKDETFYQVALPDEIAFNAFFGRYHLIDLAGCLSILYNVDSSVHSNSIYEIWIMKEYGIKDSWTKLYSVSGIEEPLLQSLNHGNQRSKIMTVVHGDQFFYFEREEVVVRYDFKKEKTHIFHINKIPQLMDPYYTPRVKTYVQSLISP